MASEWNPAPMFVLVSRTAPASFPSISLPSVPKSFDPQPTPEYVEPFNPLNPKAYPRCDVDSRPTHTITVRLSGSAPKTKCSTHLVIKSAGRIPVPQGVLVRVSVLVVSAAEYSRGIWVHSSVPMPTPCKPVERVFDQSTWVDGPGANMRRPAMRGTATPS